MFNKKFFKAFGLSLLGFFLAGALIYGGYWLGLSQALLIAEDENSSNSDEESQQILDVDFSLFWTVIELAKEKYFDIDEIDDQDILYGAIEGAISALDDPYSVFLEPSDAKKFDEDVSGSFGGIGAEIGIRSNQLVIIAPLKDTPAEAAGLKAGDKILKVDDTITANFNIEKAVKLIRGEIGTEVILLILRDDWSESKEISIIRDNIIIPTLDSEIIDGDIIHLSLYSFNRNAQSLFRQAILSALIQNPQGMILDLRNNSGGFLDVSINLASWFLERGEVVVKEQFSSGESKDLIAIGNEALKDFPVVVLINGGSASASEILAGALRDNRGIKLIGEKSFGKGSVQEIENLKDGSSLKISIAQWLTPNGYSINEGGLEPDFEVELTEEDIENDRDPQLEKAIEVLREIIL